MGMGIINATASNPLIFLYSSAATALPQGLEQVLNREGVVGSTWSYALGDEEAGLEAGETKVLAVYREVKNRMSTFDYQNAEKVQEMIEDDMTVLLLKIKVERPPSP
ncbi:hypothetical protein D3C75_1206220 [compost metagenome]